MQGGSIFDLDDKESMTTIVKREAEAGVIKAYFKDMVAESIDGGGYYMWKSGLVCNKNGVYPGFPTLFWGLSVFFVGDLMGKALWKLVENAARFPRRGGRVLCVHGAVSFHRARPCGPRWLPGRGAMRHVELDRRVLGLQSTGE